MVKLMDVIAEENGGIASRVRCESCENCSVQETNSHRVESQAETMFKSESLWCVLPRLETHEYGEAALASSMVDGRNIADNVEFSQSLFGKEVPMSSVSNKNETIDVTSCIKGYGYKGVVIRWGAPGCRERHIVLSGKMRVPKHGVQPVFSGKYPLQVHQVSITGTFSIISMEGKARRRKVCSACKQPSAMLRKTLPMRHQGRRFRVATCCRPQSQGE